MSRVCPECGREYFGKTVKCIHCNLDLVEKTDNNAQPAIKQTAAQLNYQKVQQARAAQKQQMEQLQAQQQAFIAAQAQQRVAKNKKKNGPQMKTWKLVSGIISIILALMAISQSRAVFILGTFIDGIGINGLAGIFVGIMILSGGIVSIACRKSRKGTIAIGILFGIGAFIGVLMAGSYFDLKCYSFWALICTLLAIISYCGKKVSCVATVCVMFGIWCLFSLVGGGTDNNSTAARKSTNRDVLRDNMKYDAGDKKMNEDSADLANQMRVTEYFYENTIGDTYFILIVKNNSGKTVSINSNAVAKDSNGNTIGAANGSEEAVGSGQEVCLVNYFDSVTNVSDFEYTLSVQEDRYYDAVVDDLQIEESMTGEKVIVTVTNNGDDAADFVTASALFFINNELVYYDSTYITDDDGELKSGSTLSKELSYYKGYDEVKVYYSGRK